MSRDTSTMAGRASGGVPRSGGRTAGTTTEVPAARRTRDGGAARRAATQYPVAGATALQPERSTAAHPRSGAAAQPRSGAAAQPRSGAAAHPHRSSPAPRLQVAPPTPVTAPRAPFVALVLALVVAGVVGILVINTKIVENAFTLHTLQQQQTALDLRQEGLERDLAFRESPGELAAAATRLGLVPSRTPAFIVLPDGRKLGVPQPGSSPAGR